MNFAACHLSELFQIIQTVINGGWVSVNFEPTGQIREYSVDFLGNKTLYLESNQLERDTEYTIYIDGDAVAHAKIAKASKVHTPDEEAILYLFNLCSSRIITQEISLRNASIGQKTHS